MAMNKSFSQLNRFENFDTPEEIHTPSEDKKEKKSGGSKNKALSKMVVHREKKSVRKSFMLSETAVNNLMDYSEKVGRTPNDFLNELLTNIDSYLA